MAVPKRAIHEDRDLGSRERDVDPSPRAWPVAAPATGAEPPQGAPQQPLQPVSAPRMADMIRLRPGEEAGGERRSISLAWVTLSLSKV